MFGKYWLLGLYEACGFECFLKSQCKLLCDYSAIMMHL